MTEEALGLIWANQFRNRELSSDDKDWLIEVLFLAHQTSWRLSRFAVEQMTELAERRGL